MRVHVRSLRGRLCVRVLRWQVPTDTAKIVSAALTYQLAGILPDTVTALLGPSLSRRLVRELAPCVVIIVVVVVVVAVVMA